MAMGSWGQATTLVSVQRGSKAKQVRTNDEPNSCLPLLAGLRQLVASTPLRDSVDSSVH